MDEPQPVRWFKVYVAVLSSIYLLFVIGGIIMMAMNWNEQREGVIAGSIMALLGLLFVGLFAAGLFLPRRPWAWIYALVLIACGFTSCLTLPFSIWLLIKFLEPPVKMFFGKTV